MSDKFLGSGQGSINLSNGSATIYSATLGAASLKASKPIKTNSVKQLISTNLDIADVNNLQTQLSIKDELTFTFNDTHANPANGIKIYAKTDGLLYKKDDQGLETPLAPDGYGLITVSEDELNDIDYKTDYDKTTWTNTSLDTYNFYNYYAAPLKPTLRTPFVPLDNRATNVSNEIDLDIAIFEQKDNIFITGDFSITSSKIISFSCKIYGDSLTKPTITADGISTSLFNVDADNVFFENLVLVNANTSSNANCIYFGFNPEAKNNAVHNCVLRTNEFAITSDHYQIQIYNNAFEFIGTPDSHRYIYLSRCLGEVLIYENTFATNGTTGSPNTACMLINSPNGSSAFDGGHLVIYKNTSVGLIQRMAIMETNPINFKLSLLENTIETNTDFFILFGGTMLSGFTEIIAYKNTVTLMPTSAGFKGLIGWDGPSSDITYCPIVRGSLNNLPSNLRVDYSSLPNLGNILCYKNTSFTTSLEVPLNPALVAIGEISQGITGPVSSVDNSIVFFDGTTGQVIKENNNFKFITGATYGDQLKVPDIETDDHFSINEELTSLDAAITTNTANNTGSVTVHSDVSNAGSGKIISDTERNNLTANVAKLVNQSAVQFPNPITTLEGELDVAKIKSYQHNCELEFDDTDASLIADGTVTISAPGVILSGSVNVAGTILTNQTSFTQDQQLITKKYVDDANNLQNTAIGSNTTKTTNIISTNNNNTVFSGSLECGTVYLDNIRPMGNNGGEIYVYKQNGTLGLKLDTEGNFSVPSGNVSANSVIVNGTTPITHGGSGAIITTSERNAIGQNSARTQNISAEVSGLTDITGLVIVNNLKLFPASTRPSLTEGTIYIDDNQKQLNIYLNGQLNSIELKNNIDEGLGLHTLEQDIEIEVFGSVGSAGDKWGSPVLGPDGNIYAMPWMAGHVLEFNPITRATVFYAVPAEISGTFKIDGGVLHPNGKIYGIPFGSNYVLEFDPITKTAVTFGTPVGTDINKWSGGVLHPNGKIYGIPFENVLKILVIDPVAGTVSTSDFPVDVSYAQYGWSGGALARNGKICCVPYVSDNQILEIDVENLTHRKFGTLPGSFKGAVLAENGLIYGIPRGSTKVVEIDPYNSTVIEIGSTLNTPSSGFKWQGGVLAPNGKIYCCPYWYTEMLEIDPVQRTTREIETGIPETPWGYGGCCLAPDGVIYCVPQRRTDIIAITPSGGRKIPTGRYLSAYYNKT